MSFEGRVAVITGAGGGLGEAYAKYFAAHGASVLVNDIAVDPDTKAYAADRVAAAIVKAGGSAVANRDSATEGQKIIDAAIASYGRVDILVNNAGILRDASFQKMSPQEW